MANTGPLPVSTSEGKAATRSRNAPPVPRLSASLVVVNERNEILLVQRTLKATAFGGMHVFPGGNYDQKQDSSLRLTAIRETYEESGLLLASRTGSKSNGTVSRSVLDDERFAVQRQLKSFQSVCQEHGLEPDVNNLLPFTQWITPVGPPKRFRTQFYLTFLATSPKASLTVEQKKEQIPTPDGGQEVIETKFIHPSDALAEAAQQRMSLMPPQFYLLSTLADILKGSVNTAEQRAKVKQLSDGPFGQLVINPINVGVTEDKRAILAYEGDETRGGVKGRLHRSLVRFGKTGPSDITLVRNFDIFNDITPTEFSIPTTKL